MLKLNNFKRNILQVISQSDLKIDEIYFVMRDVMNEVVDLYNQQLLQDKKEAEAVAQKELAENKEVMGDAAANN